MRPFSQGQHLLNDVASYYRNNPGYWAKGTWGFFPDGEAVDGPRPYGVVLARIKKCCPDIAISKFGPDHGGSKAEAEARALLCQQIARSNDRLNIWHWNDAKHRTVEQVIDTLQKASGMNVVVQESLAELFDVIPIQPVMSIDEQQIAA